MDLFENEEIWWVDKEFFFGVEKFLDEKLLFNGERFVLLIKVVLKEIFA